MISQVHPNRSKPAPVQRNEGLSLTVMARNAPNQHLSGARPRGTPLKLQRQACPKAHPPFSTKTNVLPAQAIATFRSWPSISLQTSYKQHNITHFCEILFGFKTAGGIAILKILHYKRRSVTITIAFNFRCFSLVCSDIVTFSNSLFFKFE